MAKSPMTPEDIARRRDELVARHGPWRAHNIQLARGVFSMGDGAEGQELRVRRAVQTVSDLSASRLKGLRVLDLGCGEGGFALEFGKQGAEVVGIEKRPALVEKAEFSREALGVRHVTIVRGDARRLSAEEFGFFDVVLALGVLERLDAPDLCDVIKRIASVCKGVALIEARLVARPRASHEFEGLVLRGAFRREHPSASSRAQRSFHLTRDSMLGLLARAGFSSIAEALDPTAAEETPWLAAFKGRRVALLSAPQVNAVFPAAWGAGAAKAGRGGIARLLGRGKR